MRRHVLRAMLACALAGGATAHENIESGNPIELSVDWQPCGSQNLVPYYSVDFLRDGTVRYRGMSGVREKSEHVKHIDPARTARLAKSAMKIMSESPERSAPPPPEEAHSEYCLLLNVGKGPQTRTRAVSPISTLGKPFERQLQRSVDLRPWVCPSRGEALGMGDSARCPPPTIHFNYSEKENCGDFHVVNLFRDGQVHYYSYRTTDSDRYYKIEPEIVERLRAIGWKYESTQVYTHIPIDPNRKSIAGANMLVEYKQTLTQLAQVPWQTLSNEGECPDGLEYPQGRLGLRR